MCSVLVSFCSALPLFQFWYFSVVSAREMTMSWIKKRKLVRAKGHVESNPQDEDQRKSVRQKKENVLLKDYVRCVCVCLCVCVCVCVEEGDKWC